MLNGIYTGVFIYIGDRFQNRNENSLDSPLLGIFDYFYQWWEYERSLRMTKQELKEEYKQVEGIL